MPPAPLDALRDAPRVGLGFWPTPLHPCRALQREVGGPLVWLKRDDCTGLALGGNKTRKLEFLLGEAVARRATGVITFGALQSNHARQTAAACAQLGLPCDLVLTEMVDRRDDAYVRSGNRLLDDVLGARVHVVADATAAQERAEALVDADALRYVIPPGGSTVVGTLGYVAAAAELAGQLAGYGLEADTVVTAASTGGTAAGLVVGMAAAGVDLHVEVAAVHDTALDTAGRIGRLAERTAEELGSPPPDRASWSVHDDTLGPGYGIETEASREALELLARTEGVLLDPVYTAKAFAHLLASFPDRADRPDVVFLHTGGQPALFAYVGS